MSIKDFDYVRGELTMMEGGMTHRGTIVIAGDKGWFKDADKNKVEDAPAGFVPELVSLLLVLRGAGAPAFGCC